MLTLHFGYNFYNKIFGNKMNRIDSFPHNNKFYEIDRNEQKNSEVLENVIIEKTPSQNTINSNHEIDNLINIEKLIRYDRGNFITNLFFKTLNHNSFIEIQDLKSQQEKLEKLIKAGVDSKYFSAILENNDRAKQLSDFLFREEHLYEITQYFGHPLTFNEKGEVTFKFTERKSVTKVLLENFNKIKGDDLSQLYQDWVQKEVVLEIRDDFANGCYKHFSIKEINEVDLKKILMQNGKFNENIQIIYPSQYLTLEELQEKSVLGFDDNNAVAVNDPFAYTEEGFVEISENWRLLRPIAHTSTPPKDFTLELIVHQQGREPSASLTAHASIQLITPNGEIYSLGFQPSKMFLKNGTMLEMQQGLLVSPDHFIFLPSSNYTPYHLKYTLPNSDSFHKIMHWIAAVKGEEDQDSNLFFHPLRQNCSDFARSIRDMALQDGAKAQSLENYQIVKWENVKFKAKIIKFLINCFQNSPFSWLAKVNQGINYAGITNFNVNSLDLKGVYLPIDLIFEHMSIQ